MSGKPHSGRFGRFGGRYVSEALWTPLQAIAEGFEEASSDHAFMGEFESLLDHRLGRPTPLTLLSNLSDKTGGGKMWIKREDLCQGGNFTANLAAACALLARRMGRQWLVGETATGEFGVTLASLGNAFGLKTRIFMGREDRESEPLMVRRMEELGVELETVDSNLRGRKAASSEALRYWATHSAEAFYCSSSLAAPDPFPRMIEFFLSVIGAETRVQVDRRGQSPEYVIAPVGSGGFAAGLFSEFISDERVQLAGVQGAGEGLTGRHSASVVAGRPGVFQGTYSFLLQDDDGQVLSPTSVAGGLSVPNVGPQHAQWAEQGRVHYVAVTDGEAVDAVRRLLDTEGLLISLEAGHALAYALKLLPTLDEDQDVVVGISGGGMRDLERLGEIESGEER
ncbi:MAG: pyridoxal-phosphate dependent enzyme [Persicimonas sp.]